MSQPEIHPAQITILNTLLFHADISFADLIRPTGLSSDHANFHLKALINRGYVHKTAAGSYTLTAAGKEFANQLDTEAMKIERQPKITVLLNIQRQADRGLEILIQQRLKQPFYGFWGLPSGKVRWGETILETAARELLEETGLVCEQLRWYGLYHKIDFNQQTSDLLEDKLFCQVMCAEPTGELITEFPGGLNKFVTLEELLALDKRFEGLEQPFHDGPHPQIKLEEHYHYYQPEEY